MNTLRLWSDRFYGAWMVLAGRATAVEWIDCAHYYNEVSI